MNKKSPPTGGGATANLSTPAPSAPDPNMISAIGGSVPLILRRAPSAPDAPDALSASAPAAPAAPATATAQAAPPAGAQLDASRNAEADAAALQARNAELELQMAQIGTEAALQVARARAAERVSQLHASEFVTESETLAQAAAEASDPQVIYDAIDQACVAALHNSRNNIRARSSTHGLSAPVTPGFGAEASDSPIARLDFQSFAGGLRNLQQGKPLEGAFAEIDQESRKTLQGSTMQDLPQASGRGAWVPLSAIAGLSREYRNLEAMIRGNAQAQFAQTYGTATIDSVVGSAQGETTTENTFRQDMIRGFLRPYLYERFLGIPVMTIDNNITVPFVNTAPEGKDLSEIEEIGAEGLTFSTKTTAPHRMGVRVPLTLQLLAAGDHHLGIMQLVSREMEKAMAQRCENLLYNGTGTNDQARGLLHTSGTQTLDFSSSPNHGDLVDAPVLLGQQNIPLDSPRWLMQLLWQPYLKKNLNFPGTLNAMPLWERGNPMSMNSMDGTPMVNPFMGIVEGTPAYATNLLPTDADGDSTNMKHLIFGDFGELIKVMYGMAFLTFDDVSRMPSGIVQLTINLFYDVLVLRANAFAIGKHNV